MTDQKIIEGLKQNDQQVFKQLVERNQDAVVRICKGFVIIQQDAEDIAQEVFIEVYRSISSFRGESKLTSWLYRIAVNKSLNFIRKNKRNRLISNLESLLTGNEATHSEYDSWPAQTTTEGAEETVKTVQSAIASLPKNQRIAFILNKYEDLSYKEVAEIMELSLSSVESLLHRAKNTLQKKLLSFYKKNY